jgi:alkylhydroperoxidase family enzyme
VARIPYAEIENAPEKIRDFFVKMGANDVEILNIFRMIAHSDISVREFIRLGSRLLVKPHLDPRFRELAILRIAQMNQARYEWTHHIPIAVGVGITPEQIKQLKNWQESPLFTDRDKTVLGFTEELVRDGHPTDETFAAAAAFLEPASLVELTLSIGYWSMVAKFLNTFQVDIEEDFKQKHAKILADIGSL